MKKIFIIAFLVLLTFFVSAVILNKENRTTQQNKTSDSNTKNVAEDTDNTQEYVYIPIPEDKKAQYKAEVEAYIDENVPIAKNKFDTAVKEIAQTYLFLQNGKNISEDELINIDLSIDYFYSPEFDLYMEIFKITKKYVNITLPATDDITILIKYLDIYLQKNHINNYNKLIELNIYKEKKEKTAKQFRNNIYKLLK